MTPRLCVLWKVRSALQFLDISCHELILPISYVPEFWRRAGVAELAERLLTFGEFEKISADGVNFITVNSSTDLHELVGPTGASMQCDHQGFLSVYRRVYRILLPAEDVADAEVGTLHGRLVCFSLYT